MNRFLSTLKPPPHHPNHHFQMVESGSEDVVLELQQKASKIASDDWTDISAVRIFSC